MSTANQKTMHIIVSGKVQGVLFRAYTKEWADSLGIKGWVRNKPDKTVEIFAHGNKPQLEKFLEFLKKGPPAARVSGIKTEEMDTDEIFEGFSIRYD